MMMTKAFPAIEMVIASNKIELYWQFPFRAEWEGKVFQQEYFMAAEFFISFALLFPWRDYH